MINVNDLRIGNYVDFNGNIGAVKRISKEQGGSIAIDFDNGDDFFHDDQILLLSPIKITPEWLEKLGFSVLHNPDSSKKYAVRNGFTMATDGNSWLLTYKSPKDEIARPHIEIARIKYVHELQNQVYYFRNEKKELTIGGGV